MLFAGHGASCGLLLRLPLACARLCREAATLEAHAAVVSAETRQLLQAHNGRPPLLRTAQEAHNPAHLVTEEGGVATMRLAQVLLAGYCARLPGTDRCVSSCCSHCMLSAKGRAKGPVMYMYLSSRTCFGRQTCVQYSLKPSAVCKLQYSFAAGAHLPSQTIRLFLRKAWCLRHPAHSDGSLIPAAVASLFPAAVPASLYIPQAWYKTTGGQGAFRTTIFLPPGASQEPVVHGDYQHNSKAAKNAAALAAIWQVWREGKMTSCLFPSWRSNFHAQQLGEAPLLCCTPVLVLRDDEYNTCSFACPKQPVCQQFVACSRYSVPRRESVGKLAQQMQLSEGHGCSADAQPGLRHAHCMRQHWATSQS